MSLEKMKLVKVMGDLEELDNVIMTCCQNSHFQTEQAMQYVSGVKGFAPLNEENPYSPALQKLTEIAANSKLEFEKVDSSKLDIEDSKLSEYVNKIDGTLGSLQEQRNQLRNNINMYKQSISELEHFSGLDLNLKAIFDCKFIKVRFGRLPKASYEKLGKYDKNPYILFFPCSTDNVGYWGVYFTPIHAAQDVDRIFASLYFERLIIPDLSGTPDECLESLKKQIDSTEKEIDELTEQISKFWESETDRAQLVFSRLTKLSNMFDLRRNACKYGKGFYFIGWIPARYSGSLKKALGAIDGIDFEIKNPDSTDKTTPPVLLKNNRFFKPFEFFVEMYGLPSYGEIDPTKFVAVTYILLFGIMFGDFGQGLLLSLIGLIMWKWKKMALGPILVRCGFSSAFFGLIFGSVFGFEDALDGFYHAIGLSGKPFNAADGSNTMTLLIIAISIGVALVVISMLINIYSSIKRRKWGEALFSSNGLAGLVFYCSIIYMVLSMLVLGGHISTAYVVCLIVIPLLLMFAKEPLGGLIEGDPNWKPESISDFILQNLFEVLEYVLSYVSNTVSYLRVGAFVLVHSGMMMVVFSLASTSNPIVNTLIIILGNALVIALEGLLTGIQVLRLEFYEMFSRYYSGEGRKFEPIQL